MINKPPISSEGILQRWLLIATLLFSFFSFSGFIGNAPYQRPQVFNTELVVKTHLVVKGATHLNEAFKKLPTRNISAIFPKFDIKHALIVHNLLSKTRFDYTSSHIFTFEQPKKIFQIKKVSQSSEEALPHLFRG